MAAGFVVIGAARLCGNLIFNMFSQRSVMSRSRELDLPLTPQTSAITQSMPHPIFSKPT